MNKLAKIPVWVIIAFGILLRIMYAWGYGNPLQASDAQSYMQDALHLLHGEAYIPRFPPGLPLLLAGWMAVFGKSAASMIALMLALYVVFCALLASLTHQNKGIQLLFALYPAFVFHSIVPLTHLPMAVCMLGIVFAIRKLQQARGEGGQARQLGYALLLGFFLGVGILIRPSSTVVVIVAIISLMVLSFPWAKRAKLIAITLIMCMLPLSLWMNHAKAMSGRYMINTFNSYNFFLGNNPFTPRYKTWWLGSHLAADSLGYEQYLASICPVNKDLSSFPDNISDVVCEDAYTQAAIAHIQDEPMLFLERTAARMRTFFAFDTLAAGEWRDAGASPHWLMYGLLALDAGCYLLLLLASVWQMANSRRSPKNIMLWGLVVAYAVPYFLAFSHPTYHFPVMPILALLAIEGDNFNLVTQFRNNKRFNSYSMIALVLLIIFIQAEWVFQWIVS